MESLYCSCYESDDCLSKEKERKRDTLSVNAHTTMNLRE